MTHDLETPSILNIDNYDNFVNLIMELGQIMG